MRTSCRPSRPIGSGWSTWKGTGTAGCRRLARVDGTDSRALLDDRDDAGVPVHEPAGLESGRLECLAFVCLSADQTRTGLYVVNRDGSNWSGSSWTRASRCRGRPGETTAAIYYVAAVSPRAIPSKLWSVPADGSGDATQLTVTEDGWDSHVDWSEVGVLFLRSSAETDRATPGCSPRRRQPRPSPTRATSSLRQPRPTAPDCGLARASADDAELSTLWASATDEESRRTPHGRARSARVGKSLSPGQLRPGPGWPPG